MFTATISRSARARARLCAEFEYRPVDYVPESERRTFMGIRRKDGRVGTRNYVAILASVNCSSSATRQVADYFRDPEVMKEYPNVDGVIPLGTKGGCGAHYGSSDLGVLQRTMAGIVDHPNVGGYVILSLGCEVNQPTDLIESTGLGNGHQPTVLTIQQDGGFAKTVEAGIAAVKRILPVANQVQREPIPASELVALRGGSDGWSGVTAIQVWAAPLMIVRQGGTVVLGDDGGLRRRAPPDAAREERPGGPRPHRPHPLVGELHRALRRVDRQQSGAGEQAGWADDDLREIAGRDRKGRKHLLNQVAGYGERVTERGFVHMDTRLRSGLRDGSGRPWLQHRRLHDRPRIRVRIQTRAVRQDRHQLDPLRQPGTRYGHQRGEGPRRGQPRRLGQEIFEKILAVASGERTKSELAGVGEEEYNPWIIGAML